MDSLGLQSTKDCAIILYNQLYQDYVMLARVYSIKTRKRVMLLADYLERLDVLEKYVNEVRPYRSKEDQKRLKASHGIIQEMRFCAYFNPFFREDTADELDELLDNLYVEVHMAGGV
jgi:hypothetical protein